MQQRGGRKGSQKKGMEERKDTSMSPGQDQPRGERLDPLNLVNQENGLVMLSNKQHVEEVAIEKELEIEKETTKVKPKVPEEAKIVANQKFRPKKPKESPVKEAARMKVTIPQPFSLATDKRMSQERQFSVNLSSMKEKRAPMEGRHSVDLNNKQLPRLSKSVSCINKAQIPPNARARAKTDNNSSPAASKVTRRSLTVKAPGTQKSLQKEENGLKNQSKHMQISVKQQQRGTSKLGESPTFKALPLPSFYHRNDPSSKLNTISKTLHRTGSPPLGQTQRNKSKYRNGGGGGGSQKRDISNGAKQNITKLLKTTRKALNPTKETVKSVVAAA